MNRLQLKCQHRAGRKMRVRKKIYGTQSRPRISVFRSNRFVYAQAIDDVTGRILAQSNSLRLSTDSKSSVTIKLASIVGNDLGNLMQGKKILTAVFDTNGYKYHGVVKAIAESIREAGIKL